MLLAVGAPLAFLATGLRFAPLARAAVTVPAFFVWLGSMLHLPLRRADDDECNQQCQRWMAAATPRAHKCQTQINAIQDSEPKRHAHNLV